MTLRLRIFAESVKSSSDLICLFEALASHLKKFQPRQLVSLAAAQQLWFKSFECSEMSPFCP